MANGTQLSAEVVRVVDGDTLRVKSSHFAEEESLRIMALDTEESRAGGSKPKTPWGQKAKERAGDIFQPGDSVTIGLPTKNRTP